MVIINYLFLGLSWNVFKIMLSLTCLSYLQSFSWLEISLVWIISIKNLRMLMWLREKYFMLDMVLICLKLFIYLMSTHYFPPWSVFHGDGVLVDSFIYLLCYSIRADSSSLSESHFFPMKTYLLFPAFFVTFSFLN
jgi:hypothetical protein